MPGILEKGEALEDFFWKLVRGPEAISRGVSANFVLVLLFTIESADAKGKHELQTLKMSSR